MGSDSIYKLLVVDDDPDAQELLRRSLNEAEYEVQIAASAEDALACLKASSPDLILLDIIMPGISGLEFLQNLRRAEEFEHVPVILVSCLDDVQSVVEGLKDGANDYVSKPISIPILLARVQTHLKIGILIRELERQRELLTRLAAYDDLTSVLNRRSFTAVLDAEISRSGRHQHKLSLLLLDIDLFKRVNDTYGHPAGDEVLIEFARRLSECIRASDDIGRYGGEEFCILLPETGERAAAALAERCREAIAGKPFLVGDQVLTITVSIGLVSTALKSQPTVAQLLDQVDHALYRAKENGRNRVETAKVL